MLSGLRDEPYEPKMTATLEFWSKKTLFLIALASGRRVSEIHALSILPQYTQFYNDKVILTTVVGFRAKNQKQNDTTQEIVIPKLDKITDCKVELKLCPVRALRHYLELTKPLRGAQTALFICHGRSMHTTAATIQTLSRWFKEVIHLAYSGDILNTEEGKISAHIHQLRAMANSLAFSRKATLAEVMRAGYWKSPNVFISCYLMDMTIHEPSGRKRLGHYVAGQRVV